MNALGWLVLILVAAAALVALAAWFYRRATNEVALVRTGVGGRQVALDGGTLAVPWFHEVARVNMQTIRMDVARTGAEAFITRDRMRVDIGAQFYVSVVPEAEAVARAAQTLGRRTFQPDQMSALIGGMLVDALRAEAARMTMDELHEDRRAFAAAVGEALAPTLARYGLALDSVSIATFDQTPLAALDEDNAFNAVGMRRLAELVASSRKERAEIEGESEVAVRRAAMETMRRKLEIDLEERRAQIAQAQEVETLLARQLAEVAARKAEAESAAAGARIRMEQQIQSAEIAREQAVREAEIARARAVAMAEQDREIALAARSEEESAAQVRAHGARAEVARAAEAVETARRLAEAERRKAVALLLAQEEAEGAATRARIAAESDRATAGDRAEARRQEAEATKAVRLAEAEAERARIEAGNARSDALAALEMERERLAALPGIVAALVKPAEKIGSIHVVSGLGREGAASPVQHATDAIMEMAVGLPLLKRIGEQIGLDLDATLEGVARRKEP